jgi:hypothetical protein
MTTENIWPDGKRFAFTIHDDTDSGTVENVGRIYAFLSDCGIYTTKSCWPLRGDLNRGRLAGETLEDPDYRRFLLDLHAKDFGIDFHGATWHTSRRDETAASLERFAEVFGHYPLLATNHTDNEESMYWGDARLTGWRRLAYNLMTRFHNHGKYRGHVKGDELFWGDLCKAKIKYVRNFVFHDVNTLKACPWMPYHDPTKPYVNYWFASSDGHDVSAFNRCLSERNLDRLEAEGGACIMYTHFAKSFQEGNDLNPRFKQLMLRLSKMNGWFARVARVLDRLIEVRGHHDLTPSERRRLEIRWLVEKAVVGPS